MCIPEVYIAGPLFTPAERTYLEEIELICRRCGFTTYLPHRDAGIAPADGSVTAPFFESDVDNLKNCRLIVSVLNGTDVDSGTAWELGYAHALGKVAIGIYEDTRIDNPMASFNLMITSSMDVVASRPALEEWLGRFKTRAQ